MGSADGTPVVQRTRLAAYAWCEIDGSVLLVRIAPGEQAAGHWTLPGGGLHFGEDPDAGALRELREETGLDGEIRDLVSVRSVVLEPTETQSGHRIHAVGLLYRIAIVGGSLRDERDESTDHAAWISLAELDALPILSLVRWARATVGR